MNRRFAAGDRVPKPLPQEGKKPPFVAENISKQDEVDSKMGPDKPGWLRYWKRRLAAEVDLLPEPVAAYLREDLLHHGKLPPTKEFTAYINKRTAFKRYELSKQAEMALLKERLHQIDEKEAVEFKGVIQKPLSFDAVRGALVARQADGSQKNITFGDIVGDHVWGVSYQSDDSVPNLLKRKIAKRLSFVEAKEAISAIYDKELQKKFSLGSANTLGTLDAIDRKIQLAEQGNPMGLISLVGALAERMIVGFLLRIQYDNPELGLRVERSNVLEDAVLKYDFKVFLSKLRGIALEPQGMSRDEYVQNKRQLGVQLTTTNKKANLEKKKGQISQAKEDLETYEQLVKGIVDDIALVSVPELKDFREHYKRWRAEGCTSGGPEQYLTSNQKTAIFKKVVEHLATLAPEDLQRLKI